MTDEYDGIGMERLEMKKIHLPIIIEIDEDGYYIVTCPLFKGCHSYGIAAFLKDKKDGFPLSRE